MKIDILTLFPEMFKGPFDESIVNRAKVKKLVEINIYNLRKWTTDKHKSVDDRPYGGGVGMVLMVEPIDKALKDLKGKDSKVILLSPKGQKYNQKLARKLSSEKHLILISGHYEGFDERIRQKLVDAEISIGDYVLTGGELPVMVIVDSIVRLIPEVLKKEEATKLESFTDNLLEYPQYTRPENYSGWKVPKVLLSGDHKKIEKWRKEQSIKTTIKKRPDLLA
jgi:tRNA (guanine37-N1)-methyltransferase